MKKPSTKLGVKSTSGFSVKKYEAIFKHLDIDDLLDLIGYIILDMKDKKHMDEIVSDICEAITNQVASKTGKEK